MIVVLFASFAVLVGLAVAFVLMRGGLSVHMPPATSSMSGGLPPGDITSADINEVRFDTVLRGYRMDQVDDVLERLRAELARRDDELRELRSRAPAGPMRAATDDRQLFERAVPGIPPTMLDEGDVDEIPQDDWGKRLRGLSRSREAPAAGEDVGPRPDGGSVG